MTLICTTATSYDEDDDDDDDDDADDNDDDEVEDEDEYGETMSERVEAVAYTQAKVIQIKCVQAGS